MDIYDSLGVTKVINGWATVTTLGGSLMPPEVLEAMVEASKHFVDIDELQRKAGERIASLTRNEAAYISCGAAAGLTLSAAACMTGTDSEKCGRLPCTDGMKNEVIIQKNNRCGFDFAIRQTGARIVEVGSDEGTSAGELQRAITESTAAIFYFYNVTRMEGLVHLEQGIEIAHRHGVPLIVDAAAQLPPMENLWRFTQMGADLAIFSGGKGLCGPQSSGLILGRRELIEACALNSCPRVFIGRPMKVGKEEIAGLVAAVERYLKLDHEKLAQSYEAQVRYMIDELAGIPHVSARRCFPSEAGQPMPWAEVCFDEEALGLSCDGILERLRSGSPSIALGKAGSNGVFINPQTLEPGEIEIIAARLKQIVSGKA